ncbi:hypothetical protein [Neotamlana laminarinivorans]|uniref:Uncharacterized protein n=1 Tax=Neotamlana laminarinivorans TaxID=2883124 RepID=A0A9X1L2V2_9FLAO|nr:hypothetical protein [Tamlana laminarinivorans]MCB4797592.1 hypothetical protein [Tamlana laminarinivorans]
MLLPFVISCFMLSLLLINLNTLATVLIILFIFFAFVLITGIIKSAKLKRENEKLERMSKTIEEQKNEYQDFTEGHLYSNNNPKTD